MVVGTTQVAVDLCLTCTSEEGDGLALVQRTHPCAAEVTEGLQLEALARVERNGERQVRCSEAYRKHAGRDLHDGVLLCGHYHQLGRGVLRIIGPRHHQMLRAQRRSGQDQGGGAEESPVVEGVDPHGLLAVHPDAKVENGLVADPIVHVSRKRHHFIRTGLHTEGEGKAYCRNGHCAIRPYLAADDQMEGGLPIEWQRQVVHVGHPVLGAVGGLGVRGQQPCAEKK